MPTESIEINGEFHLTLKELLRPRLRAIFVGINPAPSSVRAGHYYQGRHGRVLWQRLQKYGIVNSLDFGREDEAAFAQGIGFADVVRKPTSSSKNLSTNEIREGARLLVQRLVDLGMPRPLIVFVYAKAANECDAKLTKAGFVTLRMPSPYEKRDIAHEIMQNIAEKLGNKRNKTKLESTTDTEPLQNQFATAVEIANKFGLPPKKFRRALRKEQLPWHGHNERWTVTRDSHEHQDMLVVARRLVKGK